jgi:TonB family protein
VTFVAQYTGELLVGVNDTKTDDNSGEIRFDVKGYLPRKGDWVRPGAAVACAGPAVQAAAVKAQRETEEQMQNDPNLQRSMADLQRQMDLAAGKSKQGVSVAASSPTDIDGPLDPQAVANAIHSHQGEVMDCLQRAAARGRRLPRKVTVRFTIDEDGLVGGAEVERSSVDEETATCIVHVASNWRLPSAGAPAEFSYPFILQAR